MHLIVLLASTLLSLAMALPNPQTGGTHGVGHPLSPHLQLPESNQGPDKTGSNDYTGIGDMGIPPIPEHTILAQPQYLGR